MISQETLIKHMPAMQEFTSTVSLDIETYSTIDLKKTSVYRYAECPDFGVLLIAYSFDNGPTIVLDYANDFGQEDGDELQWNTVILIRLLQDNAVLKTSFNSNFERVCLSNFFKIDLPPCQWECTRVGCSIAGLPMSLEKAAVSLGLEDKKDRAGKNLIKFFTAPCKGTIKNGQQTRNYPLHDPLKWAQFVEYCKQDVAVETAVRNKLQWFKRRPTEVKLWSLDQKINDTGVCLDLDLINQAINVNSEYQRKITEELVKITGLSNPNSIQQLCTWLSNETGLSVTSLTKDSMPELLKTISSPSALRVITLRLESNKTSIKKYEAMKRNICKDGRLRGIFQFMAAHTGRWAGKYVENLPQNHMSGLEFAREIIKTGDLELVEIQYDTPDVLSQLVRTAIIPSAGNKFVIVDYNSIEPRVLSYLAGEEWSLDVFRKDGRIYEASASKMFKVPIESITKGSNLRQKGKISVLALGYAGGVNALLRMGALKMGIMEEDLPNLVSTYRRENKHIIHLWKTAEMAAISAVSRKVNNKLSNGIKFQYRDGALLVVLPSGRFIRYADARMGLNKYGSPTVVYKGINPVSKQWCEMDTFGGKWVENIVQSYARDCLGVAMLKLNDANFKIVMHFHDEVVIEVPLNSNPLNQIIEIMCSPIDWAPGLPLAAEGFESAFYKKG